ncbi:hypothetical protein F5B20DRAFT_579199 [Whalleya microplaca]|nr:hypothetical protein F5B20DRAFT_579199 [Whalleya microplaca]
MQRRELESPHPPCAELQRFKWLAVPRCEEIAKEVKTRFGPCKCEYYKNRACVTNKSKLQWLDTYGPRPSGIEVTVPVLKITLRELENFCRQQWDEFYEVVLTKRNGGLEHNLGYYCIELRLADGEICVRYPPKYVLMPYGQGRSYHHELGSPKELDVIRSVPGATTPAQVVTVHASFAPTPAICVSYGGTEEWSSRKSKRRRLAFKRDVNGGTELDAELEG